MNIKKIGSLVCFGALLGGCASLDMQSEWQLYDGSQLSSDREVLITSKPDEATIASIESAMGYGPSAAKVVDVNGRRGPRNDGIYSFNSNWDGAYTLTLEPGVHRVTVSPSVRVTTPMGAEITFEGKPGHQYFLGQVMTQPEGFMGKMFDSGMFRWTAVLVDMTNNDIIYPLELQPLEHPGS